MPSQPDGDRRGQPLCATATAPAGSQNTRLPVIVSAVKKSGGQRFKTVLPRMVYNASTKSASITRRSPTIRAALLTPSLAPSVGISPRATTRYAPNIPTPSAATPSRVTRSRNTIQESAAVKSDSVEISSATSEAVESARPIYSNSLLSTHPSRIRMPSVSRSLRLRRIVLMRRPFVEQDRREQQRGEREADGVEHDRRDLAQRDLARRVGPGPENIRQREGGERRAARKTSASRCLPVAGCRHSTCSLHL